MSYHDLLQMYFERSTSLQNYWTLYVVVIGGLLAISSMRQRRDLLTACLVTILFSFFAYKNLGAIHDVTDQRIAVLKTIQSYTPSMTEGTAASHWRSTIEPTLAVPEYEGVRNFHILSDILTIAVYWAMEWRRAKAAKVVPVAM